MTFTVTGHLNIQRVGSNFSGDIEAHCILLCCHVDPHPSTTASLNMGSEELNIQVTMA